MPSYHFINRRSGETRELSLPETTTLDETRQALGPFMLRTDVFVARDIPLADYGGQALSEFYSGERPEILIARGETATGAGGGEVGPGEPGRAPRNRDTVDLGEDPGTVDLPDAPTHGHELGFGGRPGQPDQLSDLDEAARTSLLANAGVVPMPGGGARASAFVLRADGVMSPAAGFALVADEVQLMAPDSVRIDSATVSHTHYAREWQSQTIGSAEAEVDIPMFLQGKAKYRHVGAAAGGASGQHVYLQASQHLPKARVALLNPTLSDGFVGEIETALAAPSDAARAEALLKLFATKGQFVARDIMLGGRITLTQDRRVGSSHEAERSLDEFHMAVGAAFEAESVPVDASGALGGRFSGDSKSRHGAESEAIFLKVAGGDPGAASSRSDGLGSHWMTTLDRFGLWRVTGFAQDSVVPITEVMPADLRARVVEVLAAYFRRHTILKTTRAVGNVAIAFTDEHLSYARRISRMYFRWDQKLDGFRTVWKHDGRTIEQKDPDWHGGTAEQRFNDDFRLKSDEDIASVHISTAEAGGQGVVLGVYFQTTRGTRLPPRGQYGQKSDYPWITLSAPRIRGFHGHYDSVVDAIGLCYFELAKDILYPDYMEILEPYLFPR